MTKQILNFLVIVTFITITSCKDNNEFELKTVHVNIEDTKSIPIQLGKIIPLETNDSSLFYKISNLEKIGNKFIIQSRDILKAFDAETGKYLGNYIKKGNGPGEVTSISQIWNKDDKVNVYDFSGKKILTLSPDGKFISETRVFLSEKKSEEEYSTPNCLIPAVDGEGYICLNCFTDGTTAKNPAASIYDNQFIFVGNIEGREMREAFHINNRMTPDFHQNRILMWEALKDTLFSITKENIHPIYAFDFGKNKFPDEYQALDEFYDRYQKFKENRSTPYASGLQYFQAWKEYIIFLYSTPDCKYFIAILDTKSDKVKTFYINDDSGKYTMDTFLKVFDGNLYMALIDNKMEENNQSLLCIPIRSILEII